MIQTQFHDETPQELRDLLESLRESQTRVIIRFGDTKTGKCWNDEWDNIGYIGRSTGIKPITLLVYNKRSLGGGGILDASILKIMTSNGREVLYQVANYKPSLFEVLRIEEHPRPWTLRIDGTIYARFTTWREVRNLKIKLQD